MTLVEILVKEKTPWPSQADYVTQKARGMGRYSLFWRTDRGGEVYNHKVATFTLADDWVTARVTKQQFMEAKANARK